MYFGLLADVPGRWEFRCNVQDHFKAGMKGSLAILPSSGQLRADMYPAYRRMRSI